MPVAARLAVCPTEGPADHVQDHIPVHRLGQYAVSVGLKHSRFMMCSRISSSRDRRSSARLILRSEAAC